MATVGSKGFRSSKARIVALVSETVGSWSREISWTRIRANYPDVVVLPTVEAALEQFPLSQKPHITPPPAEELAS